MSESGWRVYRKASIGGWGEMVGEATNSEDANAVMLKYARKDASAMRKLFPGRDVQVIKTGSGTVPYSADGYELQVSGEPAMWYWAFAKQE